MRRSGKYFTVSLAILGLLAFFPLAMPRVYRISDDVSPMFLSFPLTVGAWEGRETPPDERTLEILETRNVLSREYAHASGEKLHLLLVSSQSDRRVAHPPEVCYTGANFNIFNARDTSAALGGRDYPLKEFQAVNERNPDEKEEVIYLYKVGSRFTTNYYAQQLRFAADRLTRKDSEVLLIRVAGRSKESLKSFLAELMPHLDPASAGTECNDADGVCVEG